MGFDRPVRILIDKSIERFSEVFSSGGSRDSILKIDVNELKNVVKGEIVDVSKRIYIYPLRFFCLLGSGNFSIEYLNIVLGIFL